MGSLARSAARQADRQRRAQLREEQRQQRVAVRNAHVVAKELQRAINEQQKQAVLDSAAGEVREYEESVNRLTTLHTTCAEVVDWQRCLDRSAPSAPERLSKNEYEVAEKIKHFKPGLFDRIFKRTEKKLAKLNQDIETARKKDEATYQVVYQSYCQAYTQWDQNRQEAWGILQGDPQSILATIQTRNPFEAISEYGYSMKFKVCEGGIIETSIIVHEEDIVPTDEKHLSAQGKLLVKKLSDGARQDIYQEYVCSLVLRVGRELIALLPIEMVIVTATTKLLNSQTGHQEDTPILSVAMPRETLLGLNFNQLDTSDCMKNFVHNMSFSKSGGFEAVEKLEASNFSNLGNESTAK